MEVIMVKLFVLMVLFFSMLVRAGDGEDKIIGFTLNYVELCDESDNCFDLCTRNCKQQDVLRPEIKVENINPDNNTVEIKYKGKPYWIHISEIILNQQAMASTTCAKESIEIGDVPAFISDKNDMTASTMMGVGEGCK